MKQFVYASAFALMMGLSSCSKDETTTTPPPISSEKTIEFLVNGSPTSGSYTFFSFADGKEVPVTDSNSLKWDFAMRFETFIINSKSSGPGNAYAQIINAPFSEVVSGALPGYKFDTTATQKAIKGSEWYNYNPTTRVFSPKAGVTFVFVTATGKFAKMEVLKADPADDNGNPVVPPTRPTKIKYTLRYFFQQNGTPILQ